jgi:hypothetical protein
LNEKLLIEKVQALMDDSVKNDHRLQKEEAAQLAAKIFALEPIKKEDPKRNAHQTVRIHRDNSEWVPITLYMETDENGRIDVIRIHTRYFIEEYTK